MTALLFTFKIFFALCIGHALADYPLQGDFLSKGKNKYAPIPGVPWYWCMGAHVAIHAGFVWAITGSPLLACIELLYHFGLDLEKCKGSLTFDEDQQAHLLCKAAYALCMPFMATPTKHLFGL